MSIKQGVVFALVLVVTLNLASASQFNDKFTLDIYQREYVDVELNIPFTVSAIQTDKSRIDSPVQISLNYYPHYSDIMEELETKTLPSMKFDGKSFTYTMDTPGANNMKFHMKSKIRNYMFAPEINEPVNIPSKVYGFDEYLESSDLVKVTPEIASLTKRIVGNEKDMFVALFKISEWIQENIEYDLSTMTEQATFSSEWVLQERKGVCDEVTVLFMSMARSLGIPTKFVSGLAYTNALGDDNLWGHHGWAEVYFPRVGWVPFDVVFKEYGYVDATHLKLEESNDALFESVRVDYNEGVSVVIEGPYPEVRILEAGPKVPEKLRIQADVAQPEIGFESYNIVDVSVKNMEPRYKMTNIYISQSPYTDIVDETEKRLMLKPFDQEKFRFNVKAKDVGTRNIQFFVPLVVYSFMNTTYETGFAIRDGGMQFEAKDFEGTQDGSQLFVNNRARITIDDIDVPNWMTFKQKKKAKVKIRQSSVLPATNIKVEVYSPTLKEYWHLEKMNKVETFSLPIKGSDLRPGKNKFIVNVSYRSKDSIKARDRHELSEFEIELDDLTVGQWLSTHMKHNWNRFLQTFV